MIFGKTIITYCLSYNTSEIIMHRLFALFLLLSFSTHNTINAQSLSIGSWREHLPYLQGKVVANSASRIFCATDDGLFSFEKSDNSINRFSKLNGLNDFGISAVVYSDAYKVLILAYNNTNIDLLFDNNLVLNLSDIKRKNIPGSKQINHLSLDGRYVYFSCGFGIVVLDLQRKEIKDTYFISSSSVHPEVMDVAINGNDIYAVTDDGVYQAQLNNPFIANYTAWTKIISDTGNVGVFNRAVYFDNMLLVNYSRANTDTMMAWNGSWGNSLPAELLSSTRKRSLRTENGKLYMTLSSGLFVFDNNLNVIRNVDVSVVPSPDFNDGVEDNNGVAWIGDKTRGLIKVNSLSFDVILPNGPNISRSAAMQVVDGKLWVVHGPRTKSWLNAYQYDGFSEYENGSWITYDGKSAGTPLFAQYNFYDAMSLAVDPSNKNHLFISSGGSGLIEFKDGQVLNRYDTANSTITSQIGNSSQFKVHGIALDQDRNLWIANAGVKNVLSVLKTDGTWKTFNFPGKINAQAKTGDLIVDNNGYIWATIFENVGGSDGILVFNPNYTIDNTVDDKFDVVDFASNRIRAMAKDKEGTVWVGTESGIYLFYPPSITPQQILIRQDNSYQYLLAAEVVTAIAVDGANRKWVGTETGGVYLFSSDGQNQINHFTIENSPLFSNNINSLAINGKTGEVYIGTDKGLMSYQSDAIEPKEEVSGCDDIVVYPNPVRNDYDGPIAIKGLVPNGVVKITDVSGGLVFQTTSLGTQAVWNGRNLKGEKVSTGVYLVFSSDDTSENKCVTKLMYFK
jgi:sugar lactone lactonase YvrE